MDKNIGNHTVSYSAKNQIISESTFGNQKVRQFIVKGIHLITGVVSVFLLGGGAPRRNDLNLVSSFALLLLLLQNTTYL